jgi:hypothetical protein
VTFNAAQAVFTPPAIVDPTGNPLLAPFFADVDTRSGPLVTFGTGLLGGQAAFGVNWLGVGYYSQNTDLTNSFQLLLVDRSAEPPRVCRRLGFEGHAAAAWISSWL